MLSRLVITSLLRSKHLLISWLQSPSVVILEPRKIKSDTVSTLSPSICHEVMGPDAMRSVSKTNKLDFKKEFTSQLDDVKMNCLQTVFIASSWKVHAFARFAQFRIWDCNGGSNGPLWLDALSFYGDAGGRLGSRALKAVIFPLKKLPSTQCAPLKHKNNTVP